jgi:hypothetical protein
MMKDENGLISQAFAFEKMAEKGSTAPPLSNRSFFLSFPLKAGSIPSATPFLLKRMKAE